MDVVKDGDSEFAAGNYETALTIYRMVTSLGKLPAGAVAKAKIVDADKDPGYAKANRNVRAAEVYSEIHEILGCKIDDPWAVVAFSESASLYNGGSGEGSDDVDIEAHARRAFTASPADRVKLMGTLDRVINMFPDTPSAQLAKQLRDRVMGNSSFAVSAKEQVKEDNVLRTFKMAQQYEKDGMLSGAAELYRKVISDGPGTEWASKAKDRLKAVKRELDRND